MSDTSPAPEGAFSSEGRKEKGDPSPPPAEPAPAVASIEKPRSSSLWQRHGTTALVAGVVAAVVTCSISILFQVVLAMSGGRDGRLVQDGKVTVNQNGEREVYYAIPYAGPPNLDLQADAGGMNFIKIKEQKADHFTVYPAPLQVELRWRADGVRAGK